MKKNLKIWNPTEVLKQLAQLTVTQNPRSRKVTTKFADKVISTYTPSKDYQVVDFGKVGTAFVKQVQKHMGVRNYDLRIRGGIQELRLLADEIQFAGETYRQQAVIISSTDGTRTLSVLVGLWRQICSNGMMAKVSGDSFRVRHLKGNEKVDMVMNLNFGDLEIAFNTLKDRIQILQNKTVTLEQIRKGLVQPAKSNIRKVGRVQINMPNGGEGKGTQKFLAFVHKLFTSKTDKLDYKTVPASIKKVVRELSDKAGQTRIEVSPEIMRSRSLASFKIPAYQAFQCFTEMSRAWDGAVIQTETERFLELVN